YQNEVNEIRAEKIARNANTLALIAAAQHYLDYHHQAPKPSHIQAPSSRHITSSKSHATTRNKGKVAQRDKKIQKSLALISKHFKNIYKPTNNNLRTSSNITNKNPDTSLRNMNDNQTGQFMNQRAGTVAGARETIRNQKKGVPLNAEQCNWLDDTDEEPDEQEEIERKYKETLGLLAQRKHNLNEALKTQAYETFKLMRKTLS
nr:hypothetical protein [Tanacetum cinerariifolium]